MKLTQGQIRSATGLTEPTLRVWSRHIPSLRARKGKGLKFILGDAIALMALSRVTKEFGCDISLLAAGSTALFEVCARVKISGQPSSFILFHGDKVALVTDWAHLAANLLDNPFIAVPLDPILALLSEWMNHGQLVLPL